MGYWEDAPLSNTGLASFAKGSAITVLGQGANMILTLVSTVVLSRLLPPTDFGLVAMVGVVTALGGLLRELGLTVSALRAPTLSHQQASNLFWVNTVLSAAAGAAIAFSGPLLSDIYREPRLQAITPVLAIAFFLSGMQAQIQVKLSRGKKFGTLAAITVAANAAGIATAVVLAIHGLGYWALVWQVVAVSVVEFLSKAIAARWVPARPRRNANTKHLVISGIDYAASSFIQYFATNADTFTLGVRWGAAEVGLYSRAKQLMSMPIQLLTPLVNVAVPTLNEAKARGENVQDHLLRIQSFIGMVMTWLFVITAASAPALFILVLGEDWAPAAPVFQLLALGGAAQAFSQVSWWAFLVLGTSRDLLKYNLVSKTMTALLVTGGALVSVEGAAAGLSLALLLSWLLNVKWLDKTANMTAKSFYLNGGRFLGAGVAAVLGTILLSKSIAVPMGLWLLLLQILISTVLFWAVITAFPAGRHDMKQALTALKTFHR